MKTAKELRDLRGQKMDEANGLVSTAKAEKRELTPDEATKFDGLTAEIEDLDKQVKRAEDAEKIAARSAAPATTDTPGKEELTDKDKRDLRSFNLMRAFQLQVREKPLDGVEKEVHELAEKEARANGIELMGIGVPSIIGEGHIQRRGQTVTGSSATPGDQGGVSVESGLVGFVDQLWASTFLDKVGARRLSGLVGNPEFLVQDSKPVIQELTEIEEMDEDEIKFSKFKMEPFRRGTAIPFSKQAILQSSVDVQAMVIDNIRMALAYKLNAESILTILAAITSGNGNLLALGNDGAAPSYENMIDLEALIDNSDAIMGQLYYLTNTKVKGKLKKTQVFSGTTGTAVYEKGQINDYPAVISNIVPSTLTKNSSSGKCSAIVLGNFNDFLVGMWGGADFVIDEKGRAKKGEILVVANMFWQTKVARAKSFAGIKDALT